MKIRYVVLAMSLVLAVAFSVPALGGPSNPVANLAAKDGKARKAAKKAKKKANKANKAAKAA